MEQLNYHKLINLKKRMAKYDCEYSKRILAVIDECTADAKKVSEAKDKERRFEYSCEKVECEHCGKEYTRDIIYKHKRDKHGAISTKSNEFLKKAMGLLKEAVNK